MQNDFSWDNLKSEIAKKMPSDSFKAWIDPIRFLQINEKYLVIGAPTLFNRDWVYEHYRDVFRESIHELYKVHIDLMVEVISPNETAGNNSPTHGNELPLQGSRRANRSLSLGQSLQSINDKGLTNSTPMASFPDSIDQSERPPSISENQNEAPMAPTGAPQESQSHSNMNVEYVAQPSNRSRSLVEPIEPKHTFETFIVGASNQFAHAAARAVAEQPATQYNPLFVYSGAGLGKTHLLHAIANYLLKINPKTRIGYLSAERFMNEMIESIQHGKMAQFRTKYRDSYDILLMDDIQFIARKVSTQEEFFHTFNALHSSRRQIVVTSDKSPKDIPGLEDRIRTRFEWGLIADIQPPEIETRIAILRAKAEMDDIFLPNDVALFLASNIKNNIRELEGALLRLGALADLSGVEISLELAKQELGAIIKDPIISVTADVIQDTVARHFGLKVVDLKSKDRSRRVTFPRQIAMFLTQKYCNNSLTEIGIMYGGKDHTTVLHGINSIRNALETDAEVRRNMEAIQNSL